MGAIGSEESIPILEKYLDDASESVAETCVLAIDKIRYDHDPKNVAEREANKSLYNSVDPAPPIMTLSVEQLGEQLTDTSLPLFKRYRAMFGLREIGNAEAVEQLAKGLKDKSGKYMKHDAYGSFLTIFSQPKLFSDMKVINQDLCRYLK